MNIKWIGILTVLPMLSACDTDIELTSSLLSQEQLNTITNNVNTLYPNMDSELKQNIANVAVKSIENMVFVEGGSFVMGDFRIPCMNDDLNRPVWTPEASCYSQYGIVNEGADIQHDVTLSSYSLSKYEAELLDYDIYLQMLNRPFEQFEYQDKYLERNSRIYKKILPNIIKKPARSVNWHDAKNYCQWIGELTGFPVDLPTEAQWEYAARSRGKNLYHATNNGFKQYKGRGFFDPKNGGLYEEFTPITANIGTNLSVVGSFPPNPLGLYDMSNNAAEWVNDWYAKNYYKVSPITDPTGPELGELKVMRGGVNMMTVGRAFEKPSHNDLPHRSSFRCAIQHTTPPY